MNRRSASPGRGLGVILSLVFVLAVLMGAGPGIYLVNPDVSQPDVRVAWFGVPIIYAWVMLWFLVQATVIVIAYFCLWAEPASGVPRETVDRAVPPEGASS